MSAFIVNKSHINAMIESGLSVRYRPLYWYHDGQSYVLNDDTANQVGQMLLDECVRSVCHRYQDSDMTNQPGPTNAEWLIPFEYHFTGGRRPKAIEAIKEAIAMGCDKGILLSDNKFAGSDTWATSYVLSRCINKIGNFDLILCGERATDGDTAQVGPGIASFLNLPLSTFTSEIARLEKDLSRTPSG